MIGPRVALLDGESLDLERAGILRFVHEASLGSTMDRAHTLAAEGASAGTLVVADAQHAGRGRSGKSWYSEPGAGLWCTLLERLDSADSLQVLSLRVGMGVAEALAPFCDDPIALKWPNDVLVLSSVESLPRETPSRPPLAALHKVAGILVEARWRESRVEWVAIGLGVNRRVPDALSTTVRAAAVRPGVSRAALLSVLVPALRDAAACTGPLTAAELAAWAARDAMVGRPCASPVQGVVQGIDADGSVRIALPDGRTAVHRSGSLIPTEEDGPC